MICVTLVCIEGRSLTCFSSVKCLGSLETLTLAFRHHKYDKFQSLHDGTTHWAFLFIPLFKVTAVSYSFNWKWCVLIHLGWNYVGLLNKSIRWIWINHYFSLLHIVNGDNWCVFWFDKNFNVGFLADTV